MQRDDLLMSIDFALLEYQRRLSGVGVNNFNECAANHMKMAGVQEFLDILRNLAESPVNPVGPKTPALDMKA